MNDKHPIRDAMASAVAKERERQGLSRRALCESAGITNSVVQHFEDRGRDIRLVTLAHLAEGLGIPLWRLVKAAERSIAERRMESER